MNDGFCDKCLKFVEHENIVMAKTPIGRFAICMDCQVDINCLDRDGQKAVFEELAKAALTSEASLEKKP